MRRAIRIRRIATETIAGENVLAKGIRINQLAKDLGVESKAILAKCRDEGLGEKVPNHMSVVSVGLAETIKEWFTGHDAGGGGGTAVETAPPVEAKPKAARARTKKKTETTSTASVAQATIRSSRRPRNRHTIAAP